MKPRYYVALNCANHLTFHAPPTIAACAREVATYRSALDAFTGDGAAPGCVFVLVVRDGTLEFLHADRFLDGVAAGDIAEASSDQGRVPGAGA